MAAKEQNTLVPFNIIVVLSNFSLLDDTDDNGFTPAVVVTFGTWFEVLGPFDEHINTTPAMKNIVSAINVIIIAINTSKCNDSEPTTK